MPFAVGLDGVLESGQQTIEHLTGYIDPDAVEFIIPEDRLDEYARKTKHGRSMELCNAQRIPQEQRDARGLPAVTKPAGNDLRFTRDALALALFILDELAKATLTQAWTILSASPR